MSMDMLTDAQIDYMIRANDLDNGKSEEDAWKINPKHLDKEINRVQNQITLMQYGITNAQKRVEKLQQELARLKELEDK